ncbi:PREDICTED: DNA excision repair protein ERCC-8 isoform X2 [Populus euphratica]|uniref:DNA excision repair protein ERCC-8 isoform X2 n=1 Tax=Populus euphratica TaxID=75702 RepID=A0AAJ6SWX0_POPEU|nr:PREDICTED: DNA excision repair protein ERCC-8 isoform X2 [Populus euphratica]
MWREIRDREAGKTRPNSFKNRVSSSRISNLQLSNYKDVVSPHRGSINSLQVDLTEGRYLLSGASDASASVFDIQHATDFEGAGEGALIAKHKSLINIDKQHQNGHKFAISSAIWYPIDTGLFVTGSYDHYIKVWDTNSTQMVINFKMPGKVYRTAMSPLATSHMLIAAGTEDVQVRLCDIASGAFAHTLSGHRVEWSTSSEWVLVTGGCDGAIRFWDIRRAGCFLVLDQSQSQLGRRPPVLARSAVSKVSTSKALSKGQNLPGKPRMPQKKSGGGNGIKHSPLGQVPAKGLKQRLHPGMLSSQDRATAHYGAVTGLKITEDGMYLLSAGSDSRIRLWDVESGRNTLVNFETARLQTSKPIQLATAQDSNLVFVPCMTSVKAFDVWSGKMYVTFRGHYEYVNCCWFSSQDQELYTGGNDRQILVWSPARLISNEDASPAEDRDNWSD